MSFLGELGVLVAVLLDDVRHFLTMRSNARPCLTCAAAGYVFHGKLVWRGGNGYCRHETADMVERRVIAMRLAELEP